ncbi:MAG: WecB/TagA/CpsF family glycosyltransferase [Chloroflexi bacterium]|nr:WecB/TagA/CpsF family glycosyltransferase [Chloroflexota bacterium]
MTKSVHILGVRVHSLTMEEVVAKVQEFVDNGTPHHIVTLNPEFLVQAHDDPQFRNVLNAAHLALADGAGLIWAARFQGSPLRARTPGVDVVRHLAGLSAHRGYRLFFLGAKRGVAATAAKILEMENPGLLVAGTHDGSPSPEEEKNIVAQIRAAAPHILFVAYGAPQQEFWIKRNMEALGVPMVMGVGGTLDYISGVVRRAPVPMQRLGLEWAFRLASQPWRWRRMLRLPRFVALLLASRQPTHHSSVRNGP